MIVMPEAIQSSLQQFLIATVVVCSLLCVRSANALDLDVRSSRSSRLDFSVTIDRSTIDFKNDSGTVELNLSRFGIVSIEVPSSGPQLGLLLGYAYADFSSSNSYESIAMDGYYLGVSVRVDVIQYDALTLALLGHYLYQSVDGEDEQATASLTWDEFSAGLRLSYRFSTVGELYGGLNGVSIDSRYRYDGMTNTRDDLENNERQITYAGFNYFVNRYETVGISYQRGMTDGFSLQFRKLF